MATRGGVGWTVGNSWKAVYNHWDSYPTALGKQVWKEVKKRGAREVVVGLQQVGDWREFLSGGICQYCGKKAGQPHSIEARIVFRDGGGYPDPEAKYHQHSNGVTDQFTPKTCDQLFIEWVYILDVKNHKFKVYSNYDTGKKKTCHNLDGKPFNRAKYDHRMIAEYDLSGDEPDWEAIEKLDLKLNG